MRGAPRQIVFNIFPPPEPNVDHILYWAPARDLYALILLIFRLNGNKAIILQNLKNVDGI